MIDDRFIGGLKVEQDFLFLIHLPTIYHYDTEGLKTQNVIDSYFFCMHETISLNIGQALA